MQDVLEDLRRYKADSMRGQDAGRQIVYTRAIDEIERLRAAIAFVRSRSARAGEILNEFDATYEQEWSP